MSVWIDFWMIACFTGDDCRSRDGGVGCTSSLSNSLYPSHRLALVLSWPHWLIWISGSWEFVLTAECWGNGPFITLMEEYWLCFRSKVPVCNSNGVPVKSQKRRQLGISSKRKTPLLCFLAPCVLFGRAFDCTMCTGGEIKAQTQNH